MACWAWSWVRFQDLNMPVTSVFWASERVIPSGSLKSAYFSGAPFGGSIGLPSLSSLGASGSVLALSPSVRKDLPSSVFGGSWFVFGVDLSVWLLGVVNVVGVD